ncbi:MarR family winged helix-turn-helix transcriptional regulator [Microlunatus flavus]|uniref:DNA-binding transcriptional regulator, MarR family n=1 Tax=Microlunatus flavus TaxID=1036181 RepID=A0A1H9M320_9ACTN|nr:MarR family winged helix-turn-helix transcriptional regulator [Microlunatus flavus]SER18014.1 DNA-binding transcriptional regulator, MarR family [Microlunatus flavus]
MDTISGAALALLLLEGFEAMTAQAVAELERRGHPGVTTTHHFALMAIDEGAGDASALGRRLGVSKQAAAKTIGALEQLGYVERVSDPADARRRPLRVTPRGYEMSAIGGTAFTALRDRLEQELGAEAMATFEAALLRVPNLRLGGVTRSCGDAGAVLVSRS